MANKKENAYCRVQECSLGKLARILLAFDRPRRVAQNGVLTVAGRPHGQGLPELRAALVHQAEWLVLLGDMADHGSLMALPAGVQSKIRPIPVHPSTVSLATVSLCRGPLQVLYPF
jgi:hypothetical protein